MNQNPIQIAIQMINSGKNPMDMLNQMAGNNQPLAQAMKIINGKNQHQLQTMAQNIAQERGINLQDLIRELGLAFPGNR